ncbi:unnamed protein product [Cylicocyclus nassatus]|uniref:Uncharacterized protein n=1 Tax=Cylicocyclus nassatus TaxID=53992 RepID=A0AA36GQ56_CYLNA|nr:unnamed protein product [Cylicocyclus nassatus]
MLSAKGEIFIVPRVLLSEAKHFIGLIWLMQYVNRWFVGLIVALGEIAPDTTKIQGVLQQTQDRFQHMSDQIIRRIDDMTKRIDDLEKNISDVMAQNQIEQQQP